MPSLREWPDADTNTLIDFINKDGGSLVTGGLRRRKGYEKLRDRVNRARSSKTHPPYTFDDIRDHCNFLTQGFGCVVGPNVKDFFRNGRSYLQPPYGIAQHPDSEDANRTTEVVVSDIPQNRVINALKNEPSVLPKIQSFKSSRRRRKARQRIQKASQRVQKARQPIVFSQGSTALSLHWWQEVFCLHSKKDRMPFQDIEAGMIRLEGNCRRAAYAFLDDGCVSLSIQPDLKEIEQNHPPLAQILTSVIQVNELSASGPQISDTTLVRSIIGRAAYDWVLQDPFPFLGTEGGPIWDELKRILEERDASATMPYFENLRLDIQFRLSEKPELINNKLPARASRLARRLAGLLEPLFPAENDTINHHLSSADGRNGFVYNKWIPSLETVFLDALLLVVKMRQREAITEFFWPLAGAIFDDSRMEPEDGATKFESEGKGVLVTMLPAAFSRVAMDDGQAKTQDELYCKAAVLLDIERY